MTIRVAINGFGRIGRLVMRAALEHANKEIEVVGVNDLGSVETNAHLLRYDSVHGRFAGEVTTGENWMDAGRGKIRVTAELIDKAENLRVIGRAGTGVDNIEVNAATRRGRWRSRRNPRQRRTRWSRPRDCPGF